MKLETLVLLEEIEEVIMLQEKGGTNMGAECGCAKDEQECIKRCYSGGKYGGLNHNRFTNKNDKIKTSSKALQEELDKFLEDMISE